MSQSKLTPLQFQLLKAIQAHTATTPVVSLAWLTRPEQRRRPAPGFGRAVAKALEAKGLITLTEQSWQRGTYVELTLKGRCVLGEELRVTAFDVKELCGPCPTPSIAPVLQASLENGMLVVRIPFVVPQVAPDEQGFVEGV